MNWLEERSVVRSDVGLSPIERFAIKPQIIDGDDPAYRGSTIGKNLTGHENDMNIAKICVTRVGY